MSHDPVPPLMIERVERALVLLAYFIELDGDIAHSEAYVCAGGPLVAPAANGGTQVRVIYGRYIDRFEKRNGEWRIVQRIVVKD